MDIGQIITPLLYRLPLFLLWFIGIVFAVIRWKHQPRSSIFAVIGFFILSTSTFFATLLPALLPELSKDFSENRTLVQFILSSMRVFPFLDAFGWIFILTAIFSGRKPETKQEPAALTSTISNASNNSIPSTFSARSTTSPTSLTSRIYLG